MLVLLHLNDIIIHDNTGNTAIEASQDEISQRWSRRFSRLMLRVPVLWGMAVLCSVTMTEFVQTCVQSAAAAASVTWSDSKFIAQIPTPGADPRMGRLDGHPHH